MPIVTLDCTRNFAYLSECGYNQISFARFPGSGFRLPCAISSLATYSELS